MCHCHCDSFSQLGVFFKRIYFYTYLVLHSLVLDFRRVSCPFFLHPLQFFITTFHIAVVSISVHSYVCTNLFYIDYLTQFTKHKYNTHLLYIVYNVVVTELIISKWTRGSSMDLISGSKFNFRVVYNTKPCRILPPTRPFVTFYLWFIRSKGKERISGGE
jgi:hypothetical protein